MTGVEETKVKVYNSYYHDNALEVFLKVVKDGRAIVTRGVATRPEWIKSTVLWCHPWISNADTTQYIEGFIAEWQSHTYYIVVSKDNLLQ